MRLFHLLEASISNQLRTEYPYSFKRSGIYCWRLQNRLGRALDLLLNRGTSSSTLGKHSICYRRNPSRNRRKNRSKIWTFKKNLVNIIESHHDAVPQTCIESKIIQIADTNQCSSSGARRMNAEEYIKRIQEMENVAMSFSGVSKAYALSAGREVLKR